MKGIATLRRLLATFDEIVQGRDNII
jgi:hypothetical protein